MAQLTDDCFAFSGPLMSLDEMDRLLAERVRAVGAKKRLPLSDCVGTVLAENVLAKTALPPFDNSAVDGFAVRHADLSAGTDTRLQIADRVQAGDLARRALGSGEAIRIFTGAPMPEGADTVFMQEDVVAADGYVAVPPGLAKGANRRLAGEDIAAGALALPRGRRLSESDIALAAAIGLRELDVARLKVGVFSTGDEVIEPGDDLPKAGLYDANRYLLLSLLRPLGVETADLGILPDQPDAIAKALTGAKDFDLLLTTGGVSTGEADHVRGAVERSGSLVFWRVGIKPGRPVAMGVVNGTAFAGLPGNPVAAFVTFVRIVRPLIDRLMGAEPRWPEAIPVRLGFAYRKKKGRREYVRVTLRRTEDGALEAMKHPQDGAGVITSLTETDGLIELPDEMTAAEPGAAAAFYPYSALTR
jgi:molybdopterin molybdotransferase